MRHNPAAGAVVIMLRTLKMHGMAQAVGELTEQGSPAFEAALPILSQLLKAETADREVRSTAYQLKAARFPNYRDLAGFDFASSEVNEALTRQLHRCEFLEDAHNVVLVGGPGTGKTHLATAIGVQAIEHHRKRVRFFSTVELVNALEQEKSQLEHRWRRGKKVCLVCGDAHATKILRTTQAEIVPMCDTCSTDWNFYGYRILKRVKPKELRGRVFKFKIKHFWTTQSFLACRRDGQRYAAWGKKMKKFFKDD